MMNVEPNKILTISLIGSILFLFWLLFSKCRFISYRVKRIFFIINVILFFIPFPEFKNHYLDILYFVTGYEPSAQGENITSLVHITVDGAIYNLAFKDYLQIIIFCLWLGIVALFFSKQFYSYRKLLNVLKNGIFSPTVEWENEIIEAEIKKQKIKRKISIQKVEGMDFPISTGFLKPTILLPDMELTKEDFALIIRHELIHIKQNDYILKLLVIMVVVIHWFNPLVYLLLIKADKICEFSCDEKVALELNEKERKTYGHLIVTFSFSQKQRQSSYFVPVSYFGSSDKEKIKERIGKMKGTTKKRKLHTIVACMAWAAAMTMSSVAVLAYQEDTTVYEEVATEDGNIDGMTEYFHLDDVKPMENFEESDIYFTGEDNIKYDISDWEEVNSVQKASCNHSYQSGTITRHIPHSDGSCTVNDYRALVCPKCHEYRLQELYHTETYTKCPH